MSIHQLTLAQTTGVLVHRVARPLGRCLAVFRAVLVFIVWLVGTL